MALKTVVLSYIRLFYLIVLHFTIYFIEYLLLEVIMFHTHPYCHKVNSNTGCLPMFSLPCSLLTVRHKDFDIISLTTGVEGSTPGSSSHCFIIVLHKCSDAFLGINYCSTKKGQGGSACQSNGWQFSSSNP